MRLPIRPALILGMAAVTLLLTIIACGESEQPTTVAPATTAAEQVVATVPSAPATPTHTPPPDATIRPTNTPVAGFEARIAPTPTPSGSARQGGTVRMSAYADTKDWDPLGSASLSSVISYSQLYNQVVQYNSIETDQVEGDLASDWQISADGLTYTFNLQPNALWGDGEPITADDVVYSMLRYANPCNSAGRSGLWRQYTVALNVVEKIDKADCSPTNANDVVRKIDDSTVEFSLRFPSGAFIKFMAVDYVKVLG